MGNFIELLNYCVCGGDKALEEHLKNHNKNASYISKTTQNEHIKLCGEVISDSIIAEVENSKFYTTIADESTDCSNKEQMSLVLRFVDKDNNIREDFLKFIHCHEGLHGSELATVLLKGIHDLGLDIRNCRGQCYDGDGSVSGHINLNALILRLNKKAIYTHCHSHRLNLVIAKSCCVQGVRNVLDQMKDISYFLNLSQER